MKMTLKEARAECLDALRAAMTRDIGPVSDEDFNATDAAKYVRSPVRTRGSLIDLTKRIQARPE